MKGIIFNIAEAFITENWGDDMLDTIMAESNLMTQDPFVAPGTYPDEDFIEIMNHATRLLEMDSSTFLKKFGYFALFKLVGRYPHFAEPFSHPKDFLMTIENVVHVEVRKLYSDTYLPTFIYSNPSPEKLIMTYHSRRKLYPFMSGLIEGVGEYFNVSILEEQRVYQVDGKEFCDFELTFES